MDETEGQLSPEQRVYGRFAPENDLEWVPAFLAQQTIAYKKTLTPETPNATEVMRTIVADTVKAIREKSNPLTTSSPKGANPDMDNLTAHLVATAAFSGTGRSENRRSLAKAVIDTGRGLKNIPVHKTVAMMSDVVSQVALGGGPASDPRRK